MSATIHAIGEDYWPTACGDASIKIDNLENFAVSHRSQLGVINCWFCLETLVDEQKGVVYHATRALEELERKFDSIPEPGVLSVQETNALLDRQLRVEKICPVDPPSPQSTTGGDGICSTFAHPPE